MTRFMKIFATLAGLTLMTACGNTQGLIDALTAAVSNTDRNAPLCVQNPFNERCDGNATYQSTRDAIRASCTLNLNTSDNCINFVVFVCERDDPYNPICTQGENDYASFQANITENCIADDEGPLCDRAVAAICTQNAFDRLCLTDLANEYNQGALVAGGEDVIGFSAARARVCDPVTGSAPDSQQCGSFIRAVCSRNPLDTVCENRDEYFVARDNFCWIQGIDGSTRNAECADIHRVNNLAENAIPACRENYVDPTGANRFNPRCYNVVIGVCNLNPFDDICEENSNFSAKHSDYIDDCTDEVADAPFCAEAKAFVCADNPFDDLCLITDYSTNDYTTERQTAINDCRTNFVAGFRCEGAAVEFCVGKTLEADLFNPLCLEHPGTDTARQPTCFNERVAVVTVGDNPITPRCATTATRICDGDSLDPLCEDVVAYRATQFSDCVQDSDHASCAAGATQFSYITPVIACLESPFSAACLDVNTEAGAAFVPHAEAAQDAYCEAGATTKIATPDHVNCTNIGSLPNYPALASAYEFTVVSNFPFGGGTKVHKTALGGFLKTGVYGTGLGSYAGFADSGLPGGGTFLENTGNFARERDNGGLWINLPSTTTDNVETGHPLNYGTNPNTFTPAPAGTSPNDGFIQTQVLYEFTSPVDSKDGFIFFIARIEDEETVFPTSVSPYAGILSTSNFGAPLAVQPDVGNGNITAIWAGQFTAHVSDRLRLNAHPTDFYVDFANGTFNIHNPDGTDGANPNGTAPKTGSITGVSRSGGDGDQGYDSGRSVYTVDGRFGVDKDDPNVSYTNGGVARKLNPGELSGEVTLVSSQFSAENVLDVTVAVNPQTTIMPLTGLIGVEGAVGVFLNPNPSKSGLVGGFTASAPAPTN